MCREEKLGRETIMCCVVLVLISGHGGGVLLFGMCMVAMVFLVVKSLIMMKLYGSPLSNLSDLLQP